MGSMVDGFCEYTRQLENGTVRLSKRSMNMNVKRDIPKAVSYMSVPRQSLDAFMEFRDMTWDIMDCYMGESQLLNLPAELRLQILHEYLILETGVHLPRWCVRPCPERRHAAAPRCARTSGEMVPA